MNNPTWESQIWMGNNDGYIWVEVQAPHHQAARNLIQRIYHPQEILSVCIVNEHGTDNNDDSSSSSSSSDNGAAVAGAVIGGTVGLVGGIFGGIGSSIKEGMDEARDEEEEAREAGGKVWEDYQAQKQKEQDQALALIGKTVKWGSVVAVSIATLALWEITLPLAIVGGGGYLLHKKNVNKNRPSSVQSQYRKEVL